MVRRAISQRSHGKIGDCEKSTSHSAVITIYLSFS